MEDSSGQSLLFQFILLLILTLLTAFFSASEMALVSLNRSRVEQKAEEGDKKFIRLLKVLENPNNFLSGWYYFYQSFARGQSLCFARSSHSDLVWPRSLG